MSKSLVILTKNFGTNFTGATAATCNIFKPIEGQFERITVICENLGDHPLNNIVIKRFKSLRYAYRLINDTKRANSVFYSDDHFGFLMKLAGVRYYHTYHGNWPDAKYVSLSMFLKSFYFIPLYYLTIKFAKRVFNVSYYMEHYTRRINPNTIIIRNGIKHNAQPFDLTQKESVDRSLVSILMIGNVDERKYKLAVPLFKMIHNSEIKNNVKFDIYGNIGSKTLAHKMFEYPFVTYKGFQNSIELSLYDFMLSTALTENLSIAICEAIMSNLPVISFNVGGLNEVIKPYENGYLVPRGNVKALFKTISHVLNKKESFNFSQALLQEFNWTKSSEKYLKVFTQDQMIDD